MNLSRTLLSVAMESGAITEEPTYNEMPLFDVLSEELIYNTEARIGEIDRAYAFVQSFESMAEKMQEAELTPASMEQYHATLNAMLVVSGVNIPVSTLTPSFEAAEKDKETIGQKAKGVVESILKWIKEKWDALLAFFKKINLFRKNKTDKLEAEAELIAKATVVDEPSTEKRYELSGNVATLTVRVGDKQGQFHRNPLPAWMIHDGAFNADVFIRLVDSLFNLKGEVGHLLNGKDSKGADLIEKVDQGDPEESAKYLFDFLKEDRYDAAFRKGLEEAIKDKNKVSDYTMELSRVQMVSAFLARILKTLNKWSVARQEAMATARRKLENNVAGSKDHKKVAAYRNAFVAAMRVDAEISKLETKCHAWICEQHGILGALFKLKAA